MQWLTPIIPGTWEAEIRKILVWWWPEYNVSKTPSQQKKLSMVPLACHPSHVTGINRRMIDQARPGQPRQKTQEPNWKITKTKRTGPMAQVVECLLSNWGALGSSPLQMRERERENKLESWDVKNASSLVSLYQETTFPVLTRGYYAQWSLITSVGHLVSTHAFQLFLFLRECICAFKFLRVVLQLLF
jgi:hypothetical protein